jgi:hypothetical protein
MDCPRIENLFTRVQLETVSKTRGCRWRIVLQFKNGMIDPENKA